MPEHNAKGRRRTWVGPLRIALVFAAGLVGLGLWSLDYFKSGEASARCAGANVHVVPNTHGTATGWLTGFGRERNYMVNNYASHLAYAQRNPGYSVAFSEVPTAIAMREIAPETFADLRDALRDGRAGLANVFYLETSPALTQGETLLRLGLESMRWQESELGARPEVAWLIDAVGIHRQIPELLAQLGVHQFVYGRNPPLESNVHIWRAPSGSEAVAVFSDSYQHWRPLFLEGALQNAAAFAAARTELNAYWRQTPTGFPTLWLVSGSDYSPAPADDRVIETVIAEVSRTPIGEACLSTPDDYFAAVQAAQRRAPDALPVYEGETLNSYNLFWFSNPRFKQSYRQLESRLLALESLTALRSVDGGAAYPAAQLQRAWTLLFLNSDRALLWGIGAGDPFYGPNTWSAADRFASLKALLDEIQANAGTRGRGSISERRDGSDQRAGKASRR